MYVKCACLCRIPPEIGVIGVRGSHDVGPGTELRLLDDAFPSSFKAS